MIGASGRAAMILFAGLFLLVGGASQAAPAASSNAKADSASNSTETVKSTKHRRHEAHSRASKTAEKTSDDKSDTKNASATAGNDAPAPSAAMPPTVANANAQLAAADTPPAAAASAMTDRANDNVQQAASDGAAAPGANNGQVVASDQLNDLDRALQQENPPAQTTPAIAATDAQPSRPAPVMASNGSSEGSAWDQSTLIGKIFIGFGALLTLASAARMLMT